MTRPTYCRGTGRPITECDCLRCAPPAKEPNHGKPA